MKKVIPLLLATIFLFNTMGYFIVFKWAEYSVKTAMKTLIHSVDKKDLTQLKISRSEVEGLEWHDSGKEVKYKGHMYDVASVSGSKEGIIIYCISDDDEDELAVGLEDHIDQHVSPFNCAKKTAMLKEKLGMKLFFQTKQEFEFRRPECNVIRYSHETNYLSASIEMSSPPPEFSHF
jgi:hypothetical protein